MSISIKFLKKHCPGLKLIVSFADPNQNHHGGIYQACNWIYTGKSADAKFGLLNGKEIHPRSISEFSVQKKQQLSYIVKKGKHRYLMPLTKQVELNILKLKKPYPKRASSKDIVASPFHGEEGGATPTDALQKENTNEKK
jgi:hypothetical protein